MKTKILNLGPLGRFGIGYERRGEATRFPAGIGFSGTNLRLKHFDPRHRLIEERDLGSGLTTNCGSLALANDFAWSATNALNSLFAKMRYHSSGTDTTAGSASQIKLNAAITTIGTSVVSGTQVLVSAANVQQYQSVATILYNTGGPFAVTEWGIFSFGSALPATTTLFDTTMSPFTGGTATTGVTTGTMTASSGTVMGQQMSLADNTGNATPHWGLVTSNTTTTVTVPAWYKTADGTAAGVTPASGNAMGFRPIMFDRRQFAAVNVNNGDSIQFTWTLTINSGG